MPISSAKAKEVGKLGGRPKGTKSKKTLEKEAVLAAFRERAMRASGVLFDSQLTLARGQTFLYKIEKEWVSLGETKGGKEKGYWKKLKPVLVESQTEIESYLEGMIEEGDPDDDQDRGATYYYLTTKEPNNNAIDSLLDRTFGKAAQSVAITGSLNISKVLDDIENEDGNTNSNRQSTQG
jgi:hypothetical protein